MTLFFLLIIPFFCFLFYYQHIGPLDFWWLMAGELLFFCALIFIFFPQERKTFGQNLRHKPLEMAFFGLAASFFLYAMFYFGFRIINLIWPRGELSIQSVYALKGNASTWRLVLFLGLIIGPGEEILWRWFLQRRWAERLGPKNSFLLIALIYSAVHLATGNLLLVLAALICGLFWGWLFLKFNSLLANIVSHSVWDVAIFVLWPLI